MVGFIFIMLFAGGISLLAQSYVKRMFSKYSRVGAQGGYSGAQVAAQILKSSGIFDVSIHEQEGMLGDHYDPLRKRLVLSSENYRGRSLAAIGVAAHECGHAIQHQQAYAPLKMRMAAVGVTTFANQALSYLFFFAMFSGLLATEVGVAAMASCWGVIMLFNLVTLPVEYDASRRAKLVLSQLGFTATPGEDVAVAKVLNAAALTYVAAFLTSLLYFLYFLMPLLTGRSDD
jgi:uncharacterized protein